MAMYTLLYLKATRTYGIAQGTLLIAMGSLDGRMPAVNSWKGCGSLFKKLRSQNQTACMHAKLL